MAGGLAGKQKRGDWRRHGRQRYRGKQQQDNVLRREYPSTVHKKLLGLQNRKATGSSLGVLWSMLFVLILILVFFVWTLFLQLTVWARMYPDFAALLAVLLITLLLESFLMYFSHQSQKRERLFCLILKEIKNFVPSRNYTTEFGYHAELQGWLKSKFPKSKIVIQLGSSRPDIVIGNVAIEVKGPTTNKSLSMVTAKCIKYFRNYDRLILALFKPRYSDKACEETISGLQQYFPTVVVIRKT